MIYTVCKVIGCERKLGSLSLSRQRTRQHQPKWGFCNGCRKGSSNVMWPCMDCNRPITSEIFTRIRCDDCNVDRNQILCTARYMRNRPQPFDPTQHPERQAMLDLIERKGDATFTEFLHLTRSNGRLCGHIRVLRKHNKIIRNPRTGLYTLD